MRVSLHVSLPDETIWMDNRFFTTVLFAYSEGQLFSNFGVLDTKDKRDAPDFLQRQIRTSANYISKSISQATLNESLRAASKKSVKVQKCCTEGQFLVEYKNNETTEWVCKDLLKDDLPGWKIKLFKSANDDEKITLSADDLPDSGLKVLMPKCTQIKPHSIENEHEIWFRILENGQPVIGLNFWVWPIWLPVSAEHCVDNTFHENQIINSTEILLYCKIEGFEQYIRHRIYHGTSFIISAFFLLSLLIINYILRNNNNNVHIWAQMSYFLAFLLYFIAETFRIFIKLDGLQIPVGRFCFFHAIVAQYFFLAASSTITVLAFDMTWTLWKMEPVNSFSKQAKIKSIILYLVFPWGIPFVVLMLGLICNHFLNPNASKEESGIFKFGHYRCSSPMWYIGTIIQGALLTLNTVYFIVTAICVIKAIYSTQFANGKTNKNFIVDSLYIILKISLVMGVTMGFALLEFYIGATSEHFTWYWVFDRIFIFGLQGFWLFLAFGCTKKNRDGLVKKYPCLQKIMNQKIFSMISRKFTIFTSTRS